VALPSGATSLTERGFQSPQPGPKAFLESVTKTITSGVAVWRERRNPGRHLETLRDMLFRDGTEAQAQDFIAEHLTPVVAFDFLMYSIENRELRPMVERQDRRPPLPEQIMTVSGCPW
jgi:hypothetical protein